MANKELLLKTLQYIKDHPEEHDQNRWFKRTPCGTTACVAGTAAILSGYRPYGWIPRYDDEGVVSVELTGYVVEVGAEHPSAENIYVEPLAQDLLGLTAVQVDRLFFCDDDDVERIINEIIAEDEAETGGRDDG